MRELDALSLDENESEYELFTAKTQLGTLVYRDPIAGALYEDWYQRVEPAGRRKFSVSEIVKFALLAAASGIVGNAAYDAIKSVVRKVAKRHKSLSFERLVSVDKYEELRRSIHDGKPATIRLNNELELQVRRRYWILVESGMENDGTAKHPPNYDDS